MSSCQRAEQQVPVCVCCTTMHQATQLTSEERSAGAVESTAEELTVAEHAASPPPPKPEYDIVKRLRLQIGSANIPHPDKASASAASWQQPPHDAFRGARATIAAPLVRSASHDADRCMSNVQVSYGGEDAWFTSDVGGGAIGVADGVGGWADSEINPAGEPATAERAAGSVTSFCNVSVPIWCC